MKHSQSKARGAVGGFGLGAALGQIVVYVIEAAIGDPLPAHVQLAVTTVIEGIAVYAGAYYAARNRPLGPPATP